MSPEPHSELKELKGAAHPEHALLDFSAASSSQKGTRGFGLQTASNICKPHGPACLALLLGKSLPQGKAWEGKVKACKKGFLFLFLPLKSWQENGLSFGCLLSAADSQTELLDTILASSYFSSFGCKQFCFSLCFAFLLGL